MAGIIANGSLGSRTAAIRYNGFYFPAAIRQSCRVESIPTSSGRTTKYVKYSLTIECIISSKDFTVEGGTNGALNLVALGVSQYAGEQISLDSAMKQLVKLLSTKGKRLTINGTGLGDIDVGPDSDCTDRDVNNGPNPLVVDIQQMMNGRALRLVWSVEFHLTHCTSLNLDSGTDRLSEFDFSTHYTVDNDGMIVRNIYGSLEIANYTNQSGIPQFWSEPYTYKILGVTFPTIGGFERRHDFTVHPSRTRLQFSITDKEIKSNNAYPKHIVKIRSSYSVTNTTPAAVGIPAPSQGLLYKMSISGNIEVAPGKPMDWAWVAMLAVIRSRINLTSIPNSGVGPKYWAFFIGITEELYDRTMSFNVSYVTTIDPRNLLAETKLFYPVDKDYEDKPITWNTHNEGRSLPNGSGYLQGFGFDGADAFLPNESRTNDKALNLCNSNQETPKNEKGKPNEKESSPPKQDVNKTDIGTNVDQATSYSHFANNVKVVSNFNVAVHGLIGEADSESPKDRVANSVATPSSAVTPTSLNLKARKKTADNVVQKRGTGEHYLVMEGSASRVIYPVAIPTITEFVGAEDKEPQLVYENTDPSQLLRYTADGKPIYFAKWKRVYALPKLGIEAKIAAVEPRYLPGNGNFSTGKSRTLPASTGKYLNG